MPLHSTKRKRSAKPRAACARNYARRRGPDLLSGHLPVPPIGCSGFAAWPALLGPLRHWGFEKRWRSLRPQIEKWLETQTTRIGHRPILYIGGHSLGSTVQLLRLLTYPRAILSLAW